MMRCVASAAAAAAVLAGCAEGVVLQAAAATNVAMSAAEIRAAMSLSDAVDVTLKSPAVAKRPNLINLIKKELTTQNRATEKEVKVHDHTQGEAEADPTGYDALGSAKTMLNEMLTDAQSKLDTSELECGQYNKDTLAELQRLQEDVSSFNAAAAAARGQVLKAQGIISFCSLRIPKVTDELDSHNEECLKVESSTRSQIAVVEADLNVTAGIMSIIGDCKTGAGLTNLLQCTHCVKNGQGVVMVQQDLLRPYINRLRSVAAKNWMQSNLQMPYGTTEDGDGEQADNDEEQDQSSFLQASRAAQLRGSAKDDADADEDADLPDDGEVVDNNTDFSEEEENSTDLSGDMMNLNISKVPKTVTPFECIPTKKCTIGPGSCLKIRDRFEVIHGGIEDMLANLKKDLAAHIDRCSEEKESLEAQLSQLGENQRTAQKDLAGATQDQVTSESSSNLKAQQHKELTSEYGGKMQGCCKEQNEFKSEMCALEKVRGELYKLKGVNITLTDCEVTDWVEGECSASCGGGFMTKTRTILQNPMGGMACPPLVMKDNCNMHSCPVNCVVADWEHWSGCTAKCGGGLRERTRSVETPMAFGGRDCGETEESEGCNGQDCNADCELGQWSDWGACSRACMGGYSRRDRAVAKEAIGTGSCPSPTSEERLSFRKCNEQACSTFMSSGYLGCKSKADVLVINDDSGSVGSSDYYRARAFVSTFLNKMHWTDSRRRSRRRSWGNFRRRRRVTDKLVKGAVMNFDSSVRWISRLSFSKSSVVSAVKARWYNGGGTAMSSALTAAEAELVNGEATSPSTVIVVTDGQPNSMEKTKAAAARLMTKARLMWVAVGGKAPREMMMELASEPKDDNVLEFPSYSALNTKQAHNQLMVRYCSQLSTPSR